MKTAVAFGPYGEFHAFSRFDCAFIKELKEKYDKVVAVVPYTAAAIITYADELLCASTEFLAKVNGHYPYVLNTNNRDNPGWIDSGFMKMAIDYSNKHYPDCDFYEFHEGNYPSKKILNELPPNCKIRSLSTLPEHKMDVWRMWKAEFEKVGKSISEKHFIIPFIEDKQVIQDKYGYMFGDKTFVILTRNFSWKVPMHNTGIRVISYIKKMLDRGYGVVNIGFPCLPMPIKNENYYEISDNTTYSEFACLLYLSKGLMAKGSSASFATHAQVDTPILLYDNLIQRLYQTIWEERNNLNIYSKHINMDSISKEDFLNVIDECNTVAFSNKYEFNKKCIMLDKLNE